MSKPESFILDSDFATLKNDATGAVMSVTFPSSQTVGAGAVVTFTADLVVGASGASIRSRITSSKDSSNDYLGSSLSFDRTGTIPGPFAVSYTIYATLSRSSPTTARLTAYVFNVYGSTLTCASGDETFTATFATFVPPFA